MACARCCEIFASPAISAVIARPPPIPRNPEEPPAMAPTAASTVQCTGTSSGTVSLASALQRAVGHVRSEQGTDGTANTEAGGEPDQPAQRNAMAALAVIAHAGQAGR